MVGFFLYLVIIVFFFIYSGWNILFLSMEILLLFLLVNFIYSENKLIPKVIFGIVCLFLGLVYGVQFFSLYRSGGYISSMAIANAETGFTTNISYHLSILFFVFFIAFFFFLIKKGFKKYCFKKISSTLVIFICFISFNPSKSDNIKVSDSQTPLRSLIYSYLDSAENIKSLNNDEFRQIQSKFKKDKIYSNEYEKSDIISKDKNIIVIFTEGLSSRWFKDENNKYINLMPEIKSLSENSINFSNYYNHTAATFRGLRGQIKSSHQYMGGWMGEGEGLGAAGTKQYFNPFKGTSLHGVLREYGYESYFFLSQQNHLNEMLETMDFNEVYGRDRLYKKWGENDRPEVLSDQELFDFTLKTLESKKEKFIGFLYNFDTHNGLNGYKKFGQGNNEVLNRFHTYDEVFGIFLKNFKNSNLHKNTILIFTTDHSTFPDKHARNADAKIPEHFVDEIPLIIYYNGVQGLKVDARYQTSIAFAPTILNLMKIRDQENYFFGCSIYDECQENRFGSQGDFYYKMNGGELAAIDASIPGEIEKLGDTAKSIQEYQLINKYHKFSD